MENRVKRFFKWLRTYTKPFFNIKFFICFFIAWMLTNGWSYVLFGLGQWLSITWMRNISLGYMSALWLPFTPEKIITFAIALVIHKLFFNRDKKSKMLLLNLKKQAVVDWTKIKSKFSKKKENDVKENDRLD